LWSALMLAQQAASGAPQVLNERLVKRARTTDAGCDRPPLERPEILDIVFGYVGIGEYLFAAGVCRNWRGRYIKLCYNQAAAAAAAAKAAYNVKREKKVKPKLFTSYKSAVITAPRLQLALQSSLRMADLQENESQFAEHIAKASLQTIDVLIVAKTYDLAWNVHLCNSAAASGQLQLLQWLRERLCPWDESVVLENAALGGNVNMLIWMQQHTAPWSQVTLQRMLSAAAIALRLPAVKWVHQQGAVWPRSFVGVDWLRGEYIPACWPVPIVKTVLATGDCTWADVSWRCQKLAAEEFTIEKYQLRAAQLLEWAHANGCPCTCAE
jgi:hypothetical protein